MNLPNKLSTLRLILSPIYFILFVYCGNIGKIIAFFLLLIIELTDVFDGIIARKTNQVTNFGKILDPFSDKIAKFTYFLSFLNYNYYPVWMFLVILYREFFLTIFRQYAEKEKTVIAARLSGKIKSEAQVVGSIIINILVIINYNFKEIVNLKGYIYIIMLFITLITVISIIDYLYAYAFLFKKNNVK